MYNINVKNGKFELIPTYDDVFIDIEVATRKSLEKMEGQTERLWEDIQQICRESSRQIFKRIHNLPDIKLSRIDTKRRKNLYVARVRGQWYWNDKRGTHRATAANLRKCPLPRSNYRR